jgi:hypothetical protein
LPCHAIRSQENCFELLGVDIMLDRALKPWLIECNSSPSLGCDTPLDVHVKGALVRDVLQLVDPPAFDRHALREVLYRRLGTGRSKAGRGTMAEDRAQMTADLEVRRIQPPLPPPPLYRQALARPQRGTFGCALVASYRPTGLY